MQPRFYRHLIINNSNRARRRAWVLMMYFGLISWVGCISLVFGKSTSQSDTPWLSWSLVAFGSVAMLLWLVGLFTVSGTAAYTLSGPLVFRVVTEPEERKPDERQRAVQNRAGHLTFMVTVFILGAAYLYWILAEAVGLSSLPIPPTRVLVWLFGGLIKLRTNIWDT